MGREGPVAFFGGVFLGIVSDYAKSLKKSNFDYIIACLADAEGLCSHLNMDGFVSSRVLDGVIHVDVRHSAEKLSRSHLNDLVGNYGFRENYIITKRESMLLP